MGLFSSKHLGRAVETAAHSSQCRSLRNGCSKKPFDPMKVQFATDFAFEAALRSELSVENCSLCAQTYVCIDVVNIIVQMLSPRIATLAELEAEGIDWKNPKKAIVQIAHLEMSDGKLLGQGFYIRAAIAYFGEDTWWKLCTSLNTRNLTMTSLVFCMVESKVRPNETIFGLTIPPKGHPLRKKAISHPSYCISKNFPDTLVAHMSVRHSVNAQLALLHTLEQFIGSKKDWNQMRLRAFGGYIPASVYLLRSKGKASKRVLKALLPDETSLTDAAFWYSRSPETLDLLQRSAANASVIEDFKHWIGPEAVAALRLADAQIRDWTYDYQVFDTE